MTYEDIRIAITARAAAFTGIDKDRLFRPNDQLTAANLDASGIFKPPADGLWCRMNIQHGTAFMAGMADKPYSRKPGQIVFQCFARPRTGMKPLNVLADALEAHFGYWSSGDLECMETSQDVVGDDGGGFYQINTKVRFRAG